MSARREWKVVWSNGDELYVVADSRGAALALATRRHPTEAKIVYCEPYGWAR